MRSLRIKTIGLAFLLTLLLGVGCEKAIPPVTPLAEEAFPVAFDKAFSKAKPETKELVSQIVAAVQAKDYPKAFSGLQALSGQSDLTKPQSDVCASALLTVNTLLQAAQAQGDAKAAETIKVYRSTK